MTSATPQNNAHLAYQSFVAYWDATTTKVAIVEAQAIIEVGSTYEYRNIDTLDWFHMADDLDRLANAGNPPILPDPYRTLITNYVAARDAYRQAVAAALPAIQTAQGGGPDVYKARQSAATSDVAYPAFEQAVQAMNARRQGGPVGIVP